MIKTLSNIFKQDKEKFELTITATHISSTDERFTMDNLHGLAFKF